MLTHCVVWPAQRLVTTYHTLPPPAHATDSGYLEALLPHLDRSWINSKLYPTAAGVAVASLSGLRTDGVDGTGGNAAGQGGAAGMGMDAGRALGHGRGLG